MSELEQQIENRREKRRALAERGIDVFPRRTPYDLEPSDVHERYSERDTESLEEEVVELRVPGRIRAMRSHGKTAFVDLHDGGAKLQVMVRTKVSGALRRPRSGRFHPRLGEAHAHADGRADAFGERALDPRKGATAPPREVAWAGRRRSSLPPALPRSDGQPREPFGLRDARANHLEPAPFSRGKGISRSRDAHDALARGRRCSETLRHAPQRARSRALSPDRPGAFPEASPRRWVAPGLRDQSELPQRGDLDTTQPRVHDVGVLPGVLRL